MDHKTNKEGIYIYGAREHNLKSINTFIPRNKITIVTGLSGSGKSSLVFDTVYAEGQRRYVDSLSTYACYFISQLKKPDLDSITGLSPAVAIDQKSISTSARSTIGTVTEIYSYLRLLFAKLGTPYCVEHKKILKKTSVNNIIKKIMTMPKNTRFLVLAPVSQGKKGEFLREFNQYLSLGYTRAKVDGEWIELSLATPLSKKKEHFIDLLIDRLIVDPRYTLRLQKSLQKAIDLTEGQIKIEQISAKCESKNYSIHATCPICYTGFPEIDPKLFSFNNPKGACQQCNGLGYLLTTDLEELKNKEESCTGFVNEDTEELTQDICPSCLGARLTPFSLSVFIKGKNIDELSSLSVEALYDFLSGLIFSDSYKIIADKILEKLKTDLNFLKKIGLGYLSLKRPIKTLSGGEAQRIRLISQVASPLIGILYILDEPSIGLHPKDHDRLLDILFHIRDRGNTVLIVEHDEKTIRCAEHIIDMGPLAGEKGGHIIAEGSVQDIIKSTTSLTGQYLSGKKTIGIASQKKVDLNKSLEIKGAYANNLKNINVKIPISCLVGVTGVSGSGKSTLVIGTIYKALQQYVHKYIYKRLTPVHSHFAYQEIKGLEFFDRVLVVNQKPIGRTPRSVPATYLGIMAPIRILMSQIESARVRGYSPGDFSFNIKGGRCEHCLGTGQIKQEMLYLPTDIIPCDICQGSRYSKEILHVLYKGKNINDILNMDISTAYKFFSYHPLIKYQIKLLEEVGLGYLKLGQSSMTLSGGEAQRIKLTRELSKKNTGKTLYILDEPTTGLHFQDIEKLICVLKKLTQKGSTVIVIEHQMDVIKSCDYLIDLGPGGGKYGGQIMAQGTPQEVSRSVKSITAPFIKM